MKRFLATAAVLLILGGLLALAFPPLRRLPTVVSLLREELAPPLAVPVAGVRPAQLADTWGAARSGGRRHEGIDIFAPCGRPVVSATRGMVLGTGQNTLGGQVVRVLGPGGTVHYYAHLSGFADVRGGDVVQPGDTLGYVGDTGNARGTPCHLHYGVYERAGGARNPYPLLAPP